MLIRPEVQLLPPFRPAGKIDDVARLPGVERVIKLNSNEAPWPPFPDAIEAMQRGLADLNRYPDNTYPRLKAALEERYGVPASQIVVGNGSHELIRLLTLILVRPGDEVLVSSPPYPAHSDSSRLVGGTVQSVPLVNGGCDVEMMAERITPQTRIVFVCSPHNPTGGIVRRRALDAYFESVPDNVVTVLDEAYHEYATDPEFADGSTYLTRGKPVVVLRTFSKIYGLAGLRCGYAFASPELSEAMHRAREPFPANRLAPEAAVASLRRQDLVEERRRVNAAERSRLRRAFDELGLTYLPSESNFLFVDVGRDAAAIVAALRRRGVLVRSGQMHASPTSLRVTIGTPEENGLFLAALLEAFEEVPLA